MLRNFFRKNFFQSLNWKGFGNALGGGALAGAFGALATGHNDGKAIFAAAAGGAAIAAQNYVKVPLTLEAQALAAKAALTAGAAPAGE